ncbi:rhomboid-related protein 4-like isoform X2 [Mugil cephalus]|nr:rhomboid-related protein 4-like isoform X2 [Mugil cephalus]
MKRSFQLGLLLLLAQLFQEGLGNLPAVTIAVLGFNVYLYVFPAAPLEEACVSLQHVFHNKEWRRLFLSPLHHNDDLLLYFNMASFLWKGIHLERRLGGGWFLYLLSVFFILTSLVYQLLQALIGKLIERSDSWAGFIDLTSLSDECAVGFSGVLFALKIVSNYLNPEGFTDVLNIRIPNRIDWCVELVLIYLIAPGTSVVAHVAGILVGLLYILGPLKFIMETCAVYSATGPVADNRTEDRRTQGGRPGTTEDMSDYFESYVAGLTEEQQIERVMGQCLEQLRRTRTTRQRRQKETEDIPDEDEEKERGGGERERRGGGGSKS